jgi:hypothetical protein
MPVSNGGRRSPARAKTDRAIAQGQDVCRNAVCALRARPAAVRDGFGWGSKGLALVSATRIDPGQSFYVPHDSNWGQLRRFVPTEARPLP